MSSPPNPLPEGVEEFTPPPSATGNAAGELTVPGDGFATSVEVIVAAPEKRFPAWSGWDVLAIVVFTVFCLIVCIVVTLLATGLATGGPNVSPDQLARNPRIVRAFLGGQAAAYLVALVGMFVLVGSRARMAFGQGIQWKWPGASAAGFFVGGIVLALAIDGLSRFLPLPKSLPIEDLFSDRTNAYLMAVFGVTLAPLLEELFFRGLLYPVLRRSLGLLTAVLLTAIGFAGIHSVQLGYAWAPILSIFVVGVVFTLVRERWSSVASSFLMHCGYNFTLFSLLWYASDHFRHLEKATG